MIKKLTYLIVLIFIITSNVYAIDALPDNWGVWGQGSSFGVDKEIFLSAPQSLTIKFNNDNSLPVDQQRTGIYQTIKIDKYLGKRIKFSAYLKTNDVNYWAYIYARSGKIYPSERINGTKDWTLLTLVFDIPENHPENTIQLAFSLHQSGQVWIDNIKWEVVDKTTPLTYHPKAPILDKPVLE